MPVEVPIAAPMTHTVALPAADHHKDALAHQHSIHDKHIKSGGVEEAESDSSGSAPIKSYTYSPAQSVLEQKKADAQRQAVRVAIWRHDVFNLFALGAINVLNLWFIASGHGFSTFWYSAMVYFMADFLWILTDQKCVKSAAPLLVHHIVSAVYALLPYAYPAVALKMAYVMTVEINTWLLTARRVMPSKFIEALFYVSWFLLRVVIAPYLVWDFWLTYHEHAEASGNMWHPILSAPVLQVALCIFYAKWTLDLLRRTGKQTKSHQL